MTSVRPATPARAAGDPAPDATARSALVRPEKSSAARTRGGISGRSSPSAASTCVRTTKGRSVVTLKVSCAGCSVEFEARRASAKWCSDRCRRREARRAAGQVAPASPVPKPPVASGVVDAVRRELEAAGVLASVNGQIALMLAERTATEDASGLARLSAALREAVTLALVTRVPEDEDEVARARRLRDATLREAIESGVTP